MTGRQLVTTPAAAVEPRAMRYLMRPWLPLGEVTILAGSPGLGKSTLLTRIAANATLGELPGDLLHSPAAVLLAGTEESEDATVVPRLLAAGAVLGRVHFLAATEHGRADTLTLPDDLDRLEAAIADTAAQLVVADPLTAHLSGAVNSHREHEVRRVLAPLTDVARRTDAAIVGVAHLNKGEADRLMERVGGSIGFVAAARSVIAFGRDPSDPDGARGRRRIIAHAKCNVAAEAGPLAAHIDTEPVTVGARTIDVPVLVIDGPTDVEADDLLASREDWTARDDAAEFLAAELAGGAVSATEIRKRGDEAGHAWRTIRRAKDKLGVRSVKQGTGGWTWELPAACQEPHGPLGPLGPLPVFPGGSKVAKVAKVANGIGEAEVDTIPLATPEQEAAIARAQSLDAQPGR